MSFSILALIVMCLLFITSVTAKDVYRPVKPRAGDPQGLTEEMRCPACLLFATQLYRRMMTDPPPTAFDAKQQVKYLAKEDRMTEIIDDAVESCIERFIYTEIVDDQFPLKPPRPGKFWMVADLVRRQELKKEDANKLKINVGLKNWLWADVYAPHEDMLEGFIKTNSKDIKPMVSKLCVDVLRVCPVEAKHTVTDAYPMDRSVDELGDWQQWQEHTKKKGEKAMEL